MNAIESSIRDFILATLREGKPELTIATTDNLLESGVIDSMGALEIATFVEETYGAHVEDDEISLENFSTLESIAALVSSKLAGPDGR